jgi:hypothetical protein
VKKSVRRSPSRSCRTDSREAAISDGFTSCRSITLTMVVPSAVTIGSPTVPAARAKATFSTCAFTPTSGSAAPRATSSLDFASTPAFFAAAAKSAADFSAAATDTAFSDAALPALSRSTSLRTLSFTSSSFGTAGSCRPATAAMA